MLISPFVIAVTIFAFLLAGLVKGVIGMGLPTISIGLLSLVMQPVEAVALLVVPTLVTNLWQMAAGRNFVTLVYRLWPVMAGVCIGTWVAAFSGLGLLTKDSTGLATMALGIALMVYSAFGLAKIHFTVRRSAEPWLGPIIGVLTGGISAATGVFAIPAIPYLQAIGLDKEDLVQAQGVSFTVSTLALTVVLIGHGTLQISNTSVSFLAVAPALLGMAIGQWVRLRVRPEVFSLCFFLGVFLLGAHFALSHR
jgi:hypothetical protein